MALPFPDGAFDAVVCQFGVMFFPDKAKSYRKSIGCSLPVGAICSTSGTRTATIRSAGSLMKSPVASSPLNPPQFYNVPFSYHQIDPIKESLIDAGFGDLQIAVVRLEKKIPDVESFRARLGLWQSANRPNPRARGVDPDRVVGGVSEALHREFGADARMPLQAIVFSATRSQ